LNNHTLRSHITHYHRFLIVELKKYTLNITVIHWFARESCSSLGNPQDLTTLSQKSLQIIFNSLLFLFFDSGKKVFSLLFSIREKKSESQVLCVLGYNIYDGILVFHSKIGKYYFFLRLCYPFDIILIWSWNKI